MLIIGRVTDVLTLMIEYMNEGDATLLLYTRCACYTACSFHAHIEVCKLSNKQPLLNTPPDFDTSTSPAVRFM
jgi:hypothetical protein